MKYLKRKFTNPAADHVYIMKESKKGEYSVDEISIDNLLKARRENKLVRIEGNKRIHCVEPNMFQKFMNSDHVKAMKEHHDHLVFVNKSAQTLRSN